ncbi:SH3 domain-containing protein [Caulobacter sp. 17J65-9]|uniref:SH3 domain-containing protein n=1 Tax=Caulobacter sp. 17J65-9 TaxID=2709382 RepID=UPI0013CD8F5D|nr:SH3 domain-containing protein [Caulobacter sp. 17J65-9]NEX93861.1 SH3 domain-containing protein [Caulobacter sp. 17J65-9]
MSTSPTFRTAVVGAALIALVGVVPAATAQERTGGGVGSITNCDAKGGKQEVGAVLGALAGAAIGSNVAKNERTAGAVAGAAAGAAAGSWTGCKMQRDEAAAGQREYKGEPKGTYSSGGYRLAPQVSPARFSKGGGAYVATANVNLRSAPSTKAGKLGGLYTGQNFQALAYAGDWVLVGQNNVGVGYVHSSYARPSGGRYGGGY